MRAKQPLGLLSLSATSPTRSVSDAKSQFPPVPRTISFVKAMAGAAVTADSPTAAFSHNARSRLKEAAKV